MEPIIVGYSSAGRQDEHLMAALHSHPEDRHSILLMPAPELHKTETSMKKKIASALLGITAAALSVATTNQTTTSSKPGGSTAQSVQTSQSCSESRNTSDQQAPQRQQRQRSNESRGGLMFTPYSYSRIPRFRPSKYSRARYYRPTKGKPTTNKLKRSHRTRRSHRRSKK